MLKDFKLSDKTFLIIASLYCLSFAAIRLLTSETLSADEAEQFFNAQNFAWGYSSQPPLFSWILILFSKFIGLNLLTIVFTKYLMLFFLYLSFYYLMKQFCEIEYAFWLSFSLLLFPIYAHEFHRDLTHSILLTLMAVLTNLIYVKVLDDGSKNNYFLLGLLIGLGFLAKYNFIFFLLALFLASFSKPQGLKLIQNQNILISLNATLLVLAPHIFWLFNNDFSSLNHAVNKSAHAHYSFISIENLLNFGYQYLPQFFIFALIVLVVFAKSFDYKQSVDHKLYIMRYLALYAFLIPILFIIILQIKYFNYRWLSPVCFTAIIAMFSFVNFRKAQKLKFLSLQSFVFFRLLCVAALLLTIALRLVYNFVPDFTAKALAIHLSSREINQKIIQKISRNADNISIISNNRYLLANLKNQSPELRVIWLERLSSDYFLGKAKLKNDEIIAIRKSLKAQLKASDQKYLLIDHKKVIPKKFRKIFPEMKKVNKIVINSIFTKNFPHSFDLIEVQS